MKKGEHQKYLRYPNLDFKRETGERNAWQKQNDTNIATTTTTTTTTTEQQQTTTMIIMITMIATTTTTATTTTKLINNSSKRKTDMQVNIQTNKEQNM